MKPYLTQTTRPGLLTLVAFLSLISSVGTVLGVILRIMLATFLGAATWMLGPIVGFVGSITSFGLVVVSILGSLLGLLLFSASLKTFDGDPRGRVEHRLWAWIVIAFDVLRLIGAGQLSRIDQWTFIYAIVVLYVTNMPESLAYFGRAGFQKPRFPDDWMV